MNCPTSQLCGMNCMQRLAPKRLLSLETSVMLGSTKSLQNQSNSQRQLDFVKTTTLYALPHNKSEATPGTIIFFDTETHYDKRTAYATGQYHRLRLGYAIAGRLERGRWTREKRLRFTTATEFWTLVNACSDPRRPIWLFAHNIGFDLTTVQFPERMASDEFRLFDGTEGDSKTNRLGNKVKQDKGFVCLDNPPIILSLMHRDKWKLICIDTFNYWTTSLAKMGEMLGKPKLEMPAYEASDEDWFVYCQNDVEIAKDAVLGYIDWIKENNLGKFRFTAPSQAMAAFRHRWNKPQIKTHNNTALRSFEREAYYGGRLQCFYIGDVNEQVFELDVTSLYPSVMHEQLYPSKLVDFCLPNTHTTLTDTQIGLDTIAAVKLKTNIGFPKKQGGLGTVYPVGEYWTTLAGPELVLAQELGLIKEIRGWAKYELRDIFTGFVTWFWQYRQEQTRLGNTLNSNLAKLLMNGLYGKFGQMTSAWRDRPDIPYQGVFGVWGEDTFADGGSSWFRSIGQCTQQFTKKEEHEYAFPAIAAYVTSYARKWMYNLIKVAGVDNVYYIATDALFVNNAGRRNLTNSGLVEDNTLGMLREKRVAESARFEALHHYTVGSYSCNGSRKKSARINADGSCTELQFESFERVLMRKPDASVHVKPITKRYAKVYNRGTVTDSGWIKPLLILE
jgi:hypothetical protein